MRKFRYGLLLLIGLAATAYCQDEPDPLPSPVPGISIDGPATAVVGQLVTLRAVVPEGAFCAWRGILLPHAEDFRVDSSARASYFSGRLGAEGRYSFVLGVAVAADSPPVLVIHTVVIGEVGPDPPPPPDPNLKGWAKWTFETVMEYVPAKGRAEAAEKLIASMEPIISATAAGAFDSPQKAREAMGAANRKALKFPGEPWKTWDREFDARLQAELDSLADGGDLTTLDQYRRLWEQIVAGLRRVMQSRGGDS